MIAVKTNDGAQYQSTTTLRAVLELSKQQNLSTSEALRAIGKPDFAKMPASFRRAYFRKNPICTKLVQRIPESKLEFSRNLGSKGLAKIARFLEHYPKFKLRFEGINLNQRQVIEEGVYNARKVEVRAVEELLFIRVNMETSGILMLSDRLVSLVLEAQEDLK